ncbi:MAG: hypothetical protein M3Z09_17090 [Acidobacteriota bacterium]|nr:hypothetical protein [Acidobacteriota bacterium]
MFCLGVFHAGLNSWFQADDFAWLGMSTQIYDTRSFFHVIFEPSRQGTLRPLSEHLFFVSFWRMFGFDAFPYRAWVMLNQCMNLVLLCWMVRRLSGSNAAGFLAAVFWTANASLATAMGWTSGYNQILCVTCLLGALACWIRFAETGRLLFYALQLLIFIAGFGVLELMVVYPALAAALAFTLSNRRRLLLWTAPLFALSVLYFLVHRAVTPRQTAGAYAMHFGPEMFATFGRYWQWTFVPLHGAFQWPVVLLASAALFAFLLRESAHRRWLVFFFVSWYAVTLAPLLPLQNHVSYYYLAVPSLGIAAASALAIANTWRGNVAAKALGMLIACVLMGGQIPAALSMTAWQRDQSLAVRNVVLGVDRIHELHPGKTILLTDVSANLYETAIASMPFRLIPGAQVYLAPDVPGVIGPLSAHLPPVSNFVLPAEPARHAFESGQIVVYSAALPVLRNVTKTYAMLLAGLPREVPRRVDPGAPLMAYLLGPEWYPIEGVYRWMPKRATLRIGGPRQASDKLVLSGYAAPESVRTGGLSFSVTVDGQPAGIAMLRPKEDSYVREFTLPRAAMGKPSVEIAITVNRTFQRDPQGRALGLVFGTFEIR